MINESNFDHRQKNMQPAQNSGKHSTSGKRNKACNLHKAQENMQLAHNTGKPLQTELL